MGYGYYERDGLKRGYTVSDTCHVDGCEKAIDRGLAYLCYCCTWYFCSEHLGYAEQWADCFAGLSTQMCFYCVDHCAGKEDAECNPPY